MINNTFRVRCAAALFAVTCFGISPISRARAETITKAPPACVEEKISHGDFLPCNSCALETKMKTAMADYLDGRGLQAMAAGIRNSIQPQGVVEGTDTPFIKETAAEVLRGKVKPENIRVCQIPDGPIYVIQYKSLLGVHG